MIKAKEIPEVQDERMLHSPCTQSRDVLPLPAKGCGSALILPAEELFVQHGAREAIPQTRAARGQH